MEPEVQVSSTQAGDNGTGDVEMDGAENDNAAETTAAFGELPAIEADTPKRTTFLEYVFPIRKREVQRSAYTNGLSQG